MPRTPLRQDVQVHKHQLRGLFLYPPPVVSVGIGIATEAVDFVHVVVRSSPSKIEVGVAGTVAQPPRHLTGPTAGADTNRRAYFVFNDLFFPVAGEYTIQFRPARMVYGGDGGGTAGGGDMEEFPMGYAVYGQPIDSVTITVHNRPFGRDGIREFFLFFSFVFFLLLLLLRGIIAANKKKNGGKTAANELDLLRRLENDPQFGIMNLPEIDYQQQAGSSSSRRDKSSSEGGGSGGRKRSRKNNDGGGGSSSSSRGTRA